VQQRAAVVYLPSCRVQCMPCPPTHPLPSPPEIQQRGIFTRGPGLTPDRLCSPACPPPFILPREGSLSSVVFAIAMLGCRWPFSLVWAAFGSSEWQAGGVPLAEAGVRGICRCVVAFPRGCGRCHRHAVGPPEGGRGEGPHAAAHRRPTGGWRPACQVASCLNARPACSSVARHAVSPSRAVLLPPGADRCKAGVCRKWRAPAHGRQAGGSSSAVRQKRESRRRLSSQCEVQRRRGRRNTPPGGRQSPLLLLLPPSEVVKVQKRANIGR